MKFNDMIETESRFLKAADLQGQEVSVTIGSYARELMDDKDTNEKKEKWCVFFQGKDKGLVLNKTNLETLAAAFTDTDASIGKEVILYSVQTQLGEGIRLRAVNNSPAQDLPF